MKHTEAADIIKGLWPKDTYLKFQTSYSTKTGLDVCEYIEMTVFVIVPTHSILDRKCIHFTDSTWQGVIDKMKIHLLPKGESSIDEIIEEVEPKGESK